MPAATFHTTKNRQNVRRAKLRDHKWTQRRESKVQQPFRFRDGGSRPALAAKLLNVLGGDYLETVLDRIRAELRKLSGLGRIDPLCELLLRIILSAPRG
jgi:hypothetical protein